MSCNDNQNYRIRNGRSTSRVLAPSGGHSSLTFGVLPTPEKKKIIEEEEKEIPSPAVVLAAPTTEGTIEEKEDEDKTTTTPTTPATKVPEKIEKKEEVHTPTSAIVGGNSNNRPVSANAFASGSNANGAQVMTGRPTSRVLAPPGGHTSFKLG